MRSELQAELDIALSSTATLSAEETLENIDSFFAQDEGWQSTEDYLRKYAEDHPQKDPLGAEQLTAAVRPEVAAWREAWRGDYDEAVRWLRDRRHSPKLEQELTTLEANVEDTDATTFEMALETLGSLLGFEAERPAKQDAAPDGAWRDGSHAWIVWEAKSEEDPAGEISVEETRQANSHGDWVRHHFSWEEPEHELKILVTPRETVHASAEGVASDGLYRVHPSTVVELSRSAVDMHRELAGEIVGLNDQEAVERMTAALKARKLDTSALIERLGAEPLR